MHMCDDLPPSFCFRTASSLVGKGVSETVCVCVVEVMVGGEGGRDSGRVLIV